GSPCVTLSVWGVTSRLARRKLRESAAFDLWRLVAFGGFAGDDHAGPEGEAVDLDRRRGRRGGRGARLVFEREGAHEADAGDVDVDVVGDDDLDAAHDRHRGDDRLPFGETRVAQVDLHPAPEHEAVVLRGKDPAAL